MRTSSESYLERREGREALADLRRHAGFGMAVSTILIAWSAWKYYFVVGVNDAFWFAVMLAGAAGFVVARVVPSLWMLPERVFAKGARSVGRLLFAAVLTGLYFALVTPVGLLARRHSKEAFVEWDASTSCGRPGWTLKEVTADSGVRFQHRYLAHSLMMVLLHFKRRKLYFLLPFLAIVLALGLALFFVKGSALAPFIYTLF